MRDLVHRLEALLPAALAAGLLATAAGCGVTPEDEPRPLPAPASPSAATPG